MTTQIKGNDTSTFGGAITANNVGAGNVLQVVNSTYQTSISSANTTRLDTGLTATITPSSTSSKILIIVSQTVFKNPSAPSGARMYLMRDSTDLISHARVGLNDSNAMGCYVSWGTSYLDSPSTTSAVTYKTQFSNHATSGLVYVNLDNDLAQITLLEIAG